jgi:hypothetical protein
MQQNRHRDVVGQVGNNGCRLLRQYVDAESVVVDHDELARALGQSLSDRTRKLGRQQIIDLDRDHLVDDLQQTEGQGAQSGPDLEDDVILGDAGWWQRFFVPCWRR